ncbi:hypothetical protein CYMTET_56092 [Cymbomonas tetramitiformis]|uniref:Uncharacterized protein n=1 Tax=Cymbomonas tetramitiformis TaxID=36881 RepID=A0AAE0BCU4_9CHLO|nr:hypothetical protein CYMTET_56092 [Cymbomonas tetramitiformis]
MDPDALRMFHHLTRTVAEVRDHLLAASRRTAPDRSVDLESLRDCVDTCHQIMRGETAEAMEKNHARDCLMLWQFASIPQRDALLWTLRVISRIRDGFHHLDTLTTRVAILDITGVSPSDAQHLRMADILGVLRRARDESRDQILGRCDLVQLWAELRYRVAAPHETLPVSEWEWKMLPTYLHSATPNKLSSYQLVTESFALQN